MASVESGTKLLRPKQVAEILGVAPSTIGAWVRAGKMKAVRTPGGHIRITTDEVDRMTMSTATH